MQINNKLINNKDILYDNQDGSDGNITLAKSTTDYKYLEIYFNAMPLYGENSVRVSDPDGKRVTLGLFTYSDPQTYMLHEQLDINGNQLLRGGQWRTRFASTPAIQIVKNSIRIIKVVGIK